MPIYEYACGSCQRSFERLVARAADRDTASCPACGAPNLKRRPSRFAAGRADLGGASRETARPGHGCGRCGDPQGPCED